MLIQGSLADFLIVNTQHILSSLHANATQNWYRICLSINIILYKL